MAFYQILEQRMLVLYPSFFNSLPASVVYLLPLQTVWTQISPDDASGQIWTQICLIDTLIYFRINYFLSYFLNKKSIEDKNFEKLPPRACKS